MEPCDKSSNIWRNTIMPRLFCSSKGLILCYKTLI